MYIKTLAMTEATAYLRMVEVAMGLKNLLLYKAWGFNSDKVKQL